MNEAYKFAPSLAQPSATTTIQVHIFANSLAELREQLQKALDDMGWAPQVPAPVDVSPPVTFAQALEEAASATVITNTPRAGESEEQTAARRRTRKPKEAPAAAEERPSAVSDAVPDTPPPAETAPAADAEPATSSLTHEQAKARAEAWINKHPDGSKVATKEVRGMLATFGVQRVAELPEAHLADFVELLEDGV